jgi:hypothetical protein
MSMKQIHKQYSQRPKESQPSNNKNPNRVAGGIKGAGADHFISLGEDGVQNKLPSYHYVQALEQKVALQSSKIQELFKKMSRLKVDN